MLQKQNSTISVLLLFIFLEKTILCDKIEILRNKLFPSCKACRVYVDSFKKGMEATANGRFEGGDAAWEEEKLGSYARSEIRLIDIQESVCSEVEEGKHQCYALNGDYDRLVEDWWFNYQTSEPDLFEYLCIKHVNVCCADLHYGPDCLPCSGYPDNVCSNNGRCKGAGTRKGNGECMCNIGYAEKACEECAATYYKFYSDNNTQLCIKCHSACEHKCSKGGPSGCLNCSAGWFMDKHKTCVDVNECISTKPICGPCEFCVNTEGSYKCIECDRACFGCTGDGPDMCITCAVGYVSRDNICIDSASENRKQHVHLMRYLTYLGLTVATCIIFQRNMVVAAIVGTCVAIYITLSEYVLGSLSSTPIESILEQVPNDF